MTIKNSQQEVREAITVHKTLIEMYCHYLEMMGSRPDLAELELRSSSVEVILEQQQKHQPARRL